MSPTMGGVPRAQVHTHSLRSEYECSSVPTNSRKVLGHRFDVEPGLFGQIMPGHP